MLIEDWRGTNNINMAKAGETYLRRRRVRNLKPVPIHGTILKGWVNCIGVQFEEIDFVRLRERAAKELLEAGRGCGTVDCAQYELRRIGFARDLTRNPESEFAFSSKEEVEIGSRHCCC